MSKELRGNLAANVKAWRIAQGITQDDAARDAKLGRATWQRAELGEAGVTLDTLAKIASVMGVDPLDLLRPPRR